MNHLPAYTEILHILVNMGKTYEDIAAELGISIRTIYRWRTTASAATHIARQYLYITHIKGTPHDPNHT